MKKVFLALLYFSLLAILYWFLTTPRTAKPIYLSSMDQISQQEKPKQTHEIFSIISEINARNSKIKTVYVPDITIKVKQNRITNIVHGELALEKDRNFRLKVTHSLTGKEMDVGSNQDFFWFWSKRMSPPALYYSSHANIDSTNLRTALNPGWMMESIGVNPINTENITVAKYKDFWAVIREKNDSTTMTLIDPVLKVVVGRYLYNTQGKMLISTEYQGYFNNIPKKVLIIWYEEGIALDWELSGIKTNSGISQSYWLMPDMRQKIELSK